MARPGSPSPKFLILLHPIEFLDPDPCALYATDCHVLSPGQIQIFCFVPCCLTRTNLYPGLDPSQVLAM
jgi:hypothetical protein